MGLGWVEGVKNRKHLDEQLRIVTITTSTVLIESNRPKEKKGLVLVH